MKAHTKSTVLCLASALAIGITSPIHAQAPKEAEGRTMMDNKSMTERCQAMMQQKKKMMAEIQSQDARLVEQVAKLESSPDDKKVSMMADILTKLVKQRADMHDRMVKMQDKMMNHAMMHVRMGKNSCDKCPMMKDTSSGEDKAETASEKE